MTRDARYSRDTSKQSLPPVSTAKIRAVPLQVWQTNILDHMIDGLPGIKLFWSLKTCYLTNYSTFHSFGLF